MAVVERAFEHYTQSSPKAEVTPLEFNLPCTNTQDAIDRLHYVLGLQNGSLEGDDEPGLDPDQRITENALRQVIRFLQTIVVLACYLEASATNAPICMTFSAFL